MFWEKLNVGLVPERRHGLDLYEALMPFKIFPEQSVEEFPAEKLLTIAMSVLVLNAFKTKKGFLPARVQQSQYYEG